MSNFRPSTRTVVGLLAASVIASVGTGVALSSTATAKSESCKQGGGDVVISRQISTSEIPVQLAQLAGDFKKVCIVNKYDDAPSPNVALEQVAAGRDDIAFVAAPAAYALEQQGVKLKVIASNVWDGKTLQIGVLPNSPIHSYRDLEGKTFGLIGLGGTVQLAIEMKLAKLGIPEDSVKYAVYPFAAMGDAIVNGQVDAGQLAEPFVTLYKNKLRYIDQRPLSVFGTPAAVSWAVTTQKFYDSHKTLMTNWQAAYLKGIERTGNVAQDRRALAFTTDILPSVANEVNLPVFETNQGIAPFVAENEAAIKFGVVKPGLSVKAQKAMFVPPVPAL